MATLQMRALRSATLRAAEPAALAARAAAGASSARLPHNVAPFSGSSLRAGRATASSRAPSSLARQSRALSVKVAAQADGLKIDLRGEQEGGTMQHSCCLPACTQWQGEPTERHACVASLQVPRGQSLGPIHTMSCLARLCAARCKMMLAGKKAFIAGVADDQVRSDLASGPLVGSTHLVQRDTLAVDPGVLPDEFIERFVSVSP